MKEEELDQHSLRLARHASELLERSANELPASIRSRLRGARRAALAESRASGGHKGAMWRRWLPAGTAAAAVLALLLMEVPRFGSGPQATSGASEDFEMLADSSALALAQDQLGQGDDVDYEFYDWAVNAGEDEHGGEAGS
jgi:hypothetical protein